MTGAAPGLEVRRLEKRFNALRAVDQVSFQVSLGTVFGLIGPNGAGKTTVIRIIMGILGADRGEVRYEGHRISRRDSRRFGYLPEERGLYQKTKLHETLVYLARLKGLIRHTAADRVDRYLERFDLTAFRRKPIQALSKGNQQKVQFIAAIMHQPAVVILDEPFAGLDPVNQIVLKEMIAELKELGATILLSTHHMDQVERLCDHICLINEGRVILSGKLAEVKAKASDSTLEITFEGGLPEGIEQWLEILETKGAKVIGSPRKEVAPTLKGLMDLGGVVAFQAREPTLEEIFIEAVKGERS